MEPETSLYKLVYCSRSRIEGGVAEVAAELHKILNGARRKNARLGVTGALLYNAGSFAQVLEGPLESIEIIFEAIQCDVRHSEVVVVQSGPVSLREFPDWSMAFSAHNRSENSQHAAAALDAAFANTFGAGEQMLATLKELIVTEDDWVLVDAA